MRTQRGLNATVQRVYSNPLDPARHGSLPEVTSTAAQADEDRYVWHRTCPVDDFATAGARAPCTDGSAAKGFEW